MQVDFDKKIQFYDVARRRPDVTSPRREAAQDDIIDS